jgi:hypothetical protein
VKGSSGTMADWRVIERELVQYFRWQQFCPRMSRGEGDCGDWYTAAADAGVRINLSKLAQHIAAIGSA